MRFGCDDTTGFDQAFDAAGVCLDGPGNRNEQVASVELYAPMEIAGLVTKLGCRGRCRRSEPEPALGASADDEHIIIQQQQYGAIGQSLIAREADGYVTPAGGCRFQPVTTEVLWGNRYCVKATMVHCVMHSCVKVSV
jgi:hypothetical protein